MQHAEPVAERYNTYVEIGLFVLGLEPRGYTLFEQMYVALRAVDYPVRHLFERSQHLAFRLDTFLQTAVPAERMAATRLAIPPYKHSIARLQKKNLARQPHTTQRVQLFWHAVEQLTLAIKADQMAGLIGHKPPTMQLCPQLDLLTRSGQHIANGEQVRAFRPQ